MWLALVQPRWMALGLLLLVPFGAVVYCGVSCMAGG